MSFSRKKGQSSFEFISIAGIMFLVFIGMFILIQSRIVDAQNERLYNSLEALANVVQTEVTLAGATPGDYSREFMLPSHLQEFSYTIELSDPSEITLRARDFEYILFLNSNISGNISYGRNIIIKRSGALNITALG